MIQSSIALLLLGVVFFCCTINGSDTIEVTIKQGKLKGTVFESRNGTKIYAFYGIPYAKPPVGQLRFQAPQKPETWNGVKDATILPPKCIQIMLGMEENPNDSPVEGQEDCLYLNVFTTAVTHDANLPVMVYIPGGGFTSGTANMYKPNYFLDKSIVLVVMNYRVGPMGFLSTADEVCPGNYGMKDQVAALKWVHQNIASFGGNPKDVTIFGESAGGVSISLHLYSHLSTGLFQKAIIQSGSALTPGFTLPPNLSLHRAQALGIMAGCSTESTRDLISCLRRVPAEEIVKLQNRLFVWDMEPILHFSVVPEPKSKCRGHAFLTENPWRQKVVNNVPIIIGITSGEGGFKGLRILSNGGKLAAELNANYKRYFPVIFGYGYWIPDEKIQEISEAMKTFYFGDEEIGKKTAKNLIAMKSDGIFGHPSIEATLRHEGKHYFYYYDHQNAWSLNELYGNKEYPNIGSAHADDLISLFPSQVPEIFPNVTHGPDLEVSQRMINYWTNFAKTGNPNGHGEELWRPVESNEFEYLHITTEQDKMEKNLLKKEFTFWKNLNAHPTYSTSDLHKNSDEL